jgi:hypothetical protein
VQNRVLKETFVIDDLNVCLPSFSSLSYRLVDSPDATNPDPGQRDRVAAVQYSCTREPAVVWCLLITYMHDTTPVTTC